MARKPRVHSPGAFYHVMLRGNGGHEIFADTADRLRLCELLADGVQRFGHRIHAYCLMGNHLHLAVEVGDVSLSRVVQNFAFRYTRAFNRRWKRTGHLFQGRFRSLEVDRDSYLLELVRYIHCNPVRAGLVKRPEAWIWSGHRAYVGAATTPWMTSELVLGMFAEGDRRLARRRYAGFVRDGLGETYREEFHRGTGAAPVEKPSRPAARPGPGEGPRLGVCASLDTAVEVVCTSFGLVEDDLTAPGRARRPAEARAWVGWVVQETGAAKLSEVARRLGRDVATLSRQVTRLRAGLRSDVRLSRRGREICLHVRRRHNAITQA